MFFRKTDCMTIDPEPAFLPKERLDGLQRRFGLLRQRDAAAGRDRGKNTSHAVELDDGIACIVADFFADHGSGGSRRRFCSLLSLCNDFKWYGGQTAQAARALFCAGAFPFFGFTVLSTEASIIRFPFRPGFSFSASARSRTVAPS